MMGMMINCSGCNQKTTCLFAAQYTHKNQHLAICRDCYSNNYRCWFLNDTLVVSQVQPLGSKKAVLYWDEGGYVTGMYEEILYPDRDQP